MSLNFSNIFGENFHLVTKCTEPFVCFEALLPRMKVSPPHCLRPSVTFTAHRPFLTRLRDIIYILPRISPHRRHTHKYTRARYQTKSHHNATATCLPKQCVGLTKRQVTSRALGNTVLLPKSRPF